MNSLWLALSKVKGLGSKRIKKIYDYNPSITFMELVKDQKVHQLVKNKSVSELLSDYHYMKEQLNQVEESIAYHEKNGIQVITIGDERYPSLLKLLDDAPIALYCKGNLQLLESQKTIAVVGTRNSSEKGNRMAFRIGEIFAKKNYVIVSGLALGIDTEGHKGALKINGNTIAVLASGLDTIFPQENEKLAEEIIEKGGLLISEYPLHTKIMRGTFVQRDRIQSGLSIAVCPIQTDIKGGTQHTIKFAKNQNRLLFCPQPQEDIPATQGIIALLKEGVISLRTSKDIEEIEKKIIEKRAILLKNVCEESCEIYSQMDLFNE